MKYGFPLNHLQQKGKKAITVRFSIFCHMCYAFVLAILQGAVYYGFILVWYSVSVDKIDSFSLYCQQSGYSSVHKFVPKLAHVTQDC